ncbi:MAG TPA: hypothetical protein PK286_13850 [Devosia sp.]|nr:hypothetical protein [Devosia sp.]
MTRRKVKKKKSAAGRPMLKPIVVGVVVLGGVLLFMGLRANDPANLSAVPEAELPFERRINQTQTYSKGDDQLRNMLRQ